MTRLERNKSFTFFDHLKVNFYFDTYSSIYFSTSLSRALASKIASGTKLHQNVAIELSSKYSGAGMKGGREESDSEYAFVDI